MATGWNSERQPLLQNENVNTSQYTVEQPSAPSYDESSVPPYIQRPSSAVHPDELPPPYTSFPQGTSPVVACRVCGLTIDIVGKADQHVVQCNHCHEATPIKTAPLGKKYVRCPCNCLLICKVSSKKISCPRPNCKRIISLYPSSEASVPHSPGVCRASCPYCQNTFSVNLLGNNCVRCTLCRKRCALIPEYAKKRSMASFVVSICALILFISVTVTTHHLLATTPGLYVFYLVLATFFIACLAQSFLYMGMKAVVIEIPT